MFKTTEGIVGGGSQPAFSETYSTQLHRLSEIPNLVLSESRLSHFIKEGITGLLLIFLIAMMAEGHAKFTNQMDSSSCSEREVKKQFSIKNKMQKKKIRA